MDLKMGSVALLIAMAPAVADAAGAETVLYRFTGGADGLIPASGLILDASGNLYGTTMDGGSSGAGTVFQLAPPAAGMTTWAESVLHSFGGGTGDGGSPAAPLALAAGDNVYGITRQGGSAGLGTAFKLVPPTGGGTPWTENVLHSFTGGNDGSYPGTPYATAWLIIGPGGKLYGTTYDGGTANSGTVVEVNSSTGKEKVLYSFLGGADGANPQAGLITGAGGKLYGTTFDGGAANVGTVFSLTPPTEGQTAWTETVLYSFKGGTGSKDGANSTAGLIADANGNLYGTTNNGGGSSACSYGGCGTVFKLVPPAKGKTSWAEVVLYRFKGGKDGIDPSAGVIADENRNLYGTTSYGGGAANAGIVFKIAP